MVEAGFADFVVDGWYGMFAPARTPKPIVDKLSADINKALKDPDSLEKWKTLGFDPIGSHAGRVRPAPEGRPRLREADDRVHGGQGG
jgi:tripartite-type tricarboxylate transporter receptor subunit TctC